MGLAGVGLAIVVEGPPDERGTVAAGLPDEGETVVDGLPPKGTALVEGLDEGGMTEGVLGLQETISVKKPNK